MLASLFREIQMAETVHEHIMINLSSIKTQETGGVWQLCYDLGGCLSRNPDHKFGEGIHDYVNGVMRQQNERWIQSGQSELLWVIGEGGWCRTYKLSRKAIDVERLQAEHYQTPGASLGRTIQEINQRGGMAPNELFNLLPESANRSMPPKADDRPGVVMQAMRSDRSYNHCVASLYRLLWSLDTQFSLGAMTPDDKAPPQLTAAVTPISPSLTQLGQDTHQAFLEAAITYLSWRTLDRTRSDRTCDDPFPLLSTIATDGNRLTMTPDAQKRLAMAALEVLLAQHPSDDSCRALKARLAKGFGIG